MKKSTAPPTQTQRQEHTQSRKGPRGWLMGWVADGVGGGSGGWWIGWVVLGGCSQVIPAPCVLKTACPCIPVGCCCCCRGNRGRSPPRTETERTPRPPAPPLPRGRGGPGREASSPGRWSAWPGGSCPPGGGETSGKRPITRRPTRASHVWDDEKSVSELYPQGTQSERV